MRRAIAALALSAALLAGCGGDSSTQRPATTQSTPAKRRSPQSTEAGIEGFGEEAKGTERAALLAAFHAYLGALAGGDEQAACSHLSATVKNSLARLAAEDRGVSCAELLEALLSPRAPRFAAVQDEGHIKVVRVRDGAAFVVFHAPGARLYQLSMKREGGGWRVATVAASVLVPPLGH